MPLYEIDSVLMAAFVLMDSLLMAAFVLIDSGLMAQCSGLRLQPHKFKKYTTYT